ncbi:MAG: acyl-CoA thioesterase [Propionibacteriaceae bacterium]|nr:acyl-CoA thioesterase [Propionibacteriaceae bacterium]
MNLFLRLLTLPFLSGRRSGTSPLGPCRTPFRVWPTDLDILRHVNNGVYLSLMDLARVDLLSRAGFSSEIRKRGWYPVVAAETISFRRSLTLFQRFEIVTTVIGWDDKAFYLTQDFVRDGVVVSSAVVRARFLGRGGERVSPQSVMDLVPVPVVQPVLPEWVAAALQTPALRNSSS